MVLPASLLAAATFVAGIPYAGSLGMWFFPSLAGPFVAIALVGALLALEAVRRGARRLGGVFALLGALTAVAAGVIIKDHAQVAAANGVSVNLLATVVPRLASVGAAPDDTSVYTRIEGQDLRVDIYRPKGSSRALAPVAVHIHGGGWNSGARTAKAANLRWLADRGYLGISLDYVLATAERATWNTAASQVACALSWVAANARTYGGDPERLFAFGESAGGALALTMAYAAASGVAASSCGGEVPLLSAVAAHVPAVDPVTFYQNTDPYGGERSRRMMNLYLGGTPMEYPDRVRAVSSATYITPKAPPTLIVLSDDDRLVPIEGALQFIDRAMQADVPLRVVRFPRADHGVAVLYYSVVNQTWLHVMRQHFCRFGGACD